MFEDLQKPLVYIGERPAEFCIVTPLPVIANHAEDIAREMGIKTCIALTKINSDVKIAEEIINRGEIKLLGTRGYTEYMLRRLTLFPILSMGYSVEIFLETLLPYQHSNIKVGYLCLPGQGLQFSRIAELLCVDGHRLEVEDRDNLEPVLKTAKNKRIELLIGGVGLITNAMNHGFKCLPLIKETRETVFSIFADAKSILNRWRINESRFKFIKTVVDNSPNIIIHITPNLTIHYANNAAIRHFSAIRKKFVNLNLAAFFPDIHHDSFLTSTDSQEIITDALGREYLYQLAPMPAHAGEEGFILILSKVEDIQKNERKVRQNSINKSSLQTCSIEAIAGDSEIMGRLRALAMRFAASEEPVLIYGETGTGKELFAQAIHTHSERGNFPFISINCASLSENLLESELFGYEKGAFTDARKEGKPGLLELAHNGTIFLDELAEMSVGVQGKLLRVLQDKIVSRLGSTRFSSINIRVICATNKNLLQLVRDGKFRRDLFYRINTLILSVPCLGDHPGDIKPITLKYLASKGFTCSLAVIGKLRARAWPGNVRELLHVLDRACVLTSKTRLEANDIIFDEELLPQPQAETESDSIFAALERNQFNREKTARALGISRTTLWKIMKKNNYLAK